MKFQLEQLLQAAVSQVSGDLLSQRPTASFTIVERARGAQHGDYVSTVALRLAGASHAGDLARAIVAAMPPNPLVARAEVAGAGFINIFLAPEAYSQELSAIHESGERYGRSGLGQGVRVLVEFGSAPVSTAVQIGDGREAAYSAALANVLAATGFDVHLECYGQGSGRKTQVAGVRVLRGDRGRTCEEIGHDACRFFYLLRSHDQLLDFDVELAKSRTDENPLYRVQYAHARVASVLKQLAARGLAFDRAEGLDNATALTGKHEQALLRMLTSYPETLEYAAVNRAPHAVVHYLRELANAFHTYYNAEQLIVPESRVRNARLALVLGVQQVIRNGLTLIGVSSPDTI